MHPLCLKYMLSAEPSIKVIPLITTTSQYQPELDKCHIAYQSELDKSSTVTLLITVTLIG